MRSKYRINFISLCLIGILSSCGQILPRSDNEVSYFILKDSGVAQKSNLAPINKRLTIANVKGNQFVDSQKMIFAKDNQTRGFYQFSNWVEPPTTAIARMVGTRLEDTGIFSSVSTNNGAIGDYQLQIEVLDFYHDISNQPGNVVVKLQVEILNLSNYQVVTRKVFSISKDTKKYSAKGAVSAFNDALKILLDQVVDWIAAQKF